MSTYNAKNYTEQGGDRLVIGGELEIKEGATVKGLETGGGELQMATGSTLGGVKALPLVEGKYYEPCYISPATGHIHSIKYLAVGLNGSSAGLVKAQQRSGLYNVPIKTNGSGNLYAPNTENQPASTATDLAELVADFNSLLAKLKAAGYVAADA